MNQELTQYSDYLLKKHHSKNTVLSYLRDVTAFSRFITQLGPRGKSWKEVTLDDARAYCQRLIDAERHNNTVNRAITSLRLLYDFLLIRGEVANNPFRAMSHLKRSPESPDVLSDEEAAWLVGAPVREYEVLADTLSAEKPKRRGKYIFIRDQLILELLYYAGLKTYELIELRDRSIDAEMMTVKITGKQSRNKGRSISIPECVVVTHREYLRLRSLCWPEITLEKSPVLLRNNHGRPVSRTLVWRTTAKYAQKSGLCPGPSPEVFRNTFTLKIIKSGAKPEALQYLLGLEDLCTARAYLDRYCGMSFGTAKPGRV